MKRRKLIQLSSILIVCKMIRLSLLRRENNIIETQTLARL
jgi:hypothetical protein